MYVQEAIESILNQTFVYFELIIINDGSSDNTREIISLFDDPRIKILHHSQNKGIVQSLNEGILLCSGKYIARMDGDDISLPERLKRQVDFLEENPHVGVCATNYSGQVGEDSFSRLLSHQQVLTFLSLFCCIGHPTIMFRRDLAIGKKNFYNPDFQFAEDYHLWVQLIQVTHFHVLKDTLLFYRLHRQNVSNVHQRRQAALSDKVRVHWFEYALQRLLTEQEANAVSSPYYNWITLTSYHRLVEEVFFRNGPIDNILFIRIHLQKWLPDAFHRFPHRSLFFTLRRRAFYLKYLQMDPIKCYLNTFLRR